MNRLVGISAGLALVAGVGFCSTLQAGETRRVEGLDFDHIDVLGSVAVQIMQGDETVLELRGPAADLDYEPFLVDGRRLVLGTSRQKKRHDFDDVQFKVVVEELRELRVKGSGEVYVKKLKLFEPSHGGAPTVSVDGSGEIKLYGIEGPDLELRVKGSGDIKAVSVDVNNMEAVVAGNGDLVIGSVNAKSGEFVVSGSGDIKVVDEGWVDELEINVVGSGDIDLRKVGCNRAEMNIVGSGNADLGDVIEKLNATVLGSGDIRYSGSPEVDSVELGSGEVRRRD